MKQKEHIPNAKTLAAIDDAMNDRNMVGPFKTVKEAMEYLESED